MTKADPAAEMVRMFRAIWLLLLLLFAAAPWSVKHTIGVTGPRHSFWHFTAFLLTAVLFSSRFDTTGIDKSSAALLKKDLLRATALASFALLIEVFETYLFHNSLEWRDVSVDCLGILAGLLSSRLLTLMFTSDHF